MQVAGIRGGGQPALAVPAASTAVFWRIRSASLTCAGVFTNVNAVSVVDETMHLRRLRSAANRLRRARADRDYAIHEAIKAKVSYRKVAEAVGLHVSHAHRIATSERKDPKEA